MRLIIDCLLIVVVKDAPLCRLLAPKKISLYIRSAFGLELPNTGSTHMRNFWSNYREDTLIVSAFIIVCLALYLLIVYFFITF